MSHAEWSIRREHSNALVCVNNNELWTFSFSEDTSPPEPNERFNLKETSTGLFLPSTLGSGNDPSHPLPAPYTPMISALKSLILQTLASSSTAFVPFGKGVISSAGKIFYVDPSLSVNGELFVKMYYEANDIRKFQLSSITNDSNKSRKVYLIPSTVIGLVLETCPPPKDLSQFKQLLERTSCIDVGTRNNRFKTWVRVRLVESGSTVIWPLDLCYTRPSLQPDQNHFEDNKQWFALEDVFGSAESQIASLKSILNNSNAKGNSGGVAPGSSASEITTASNLDPSSTISSTAPSEITAAVVDSARKPSVYPTPPDPQTMGSKTRNESVGGSAGGAVGGGGDTVESTTNWVTPGGMNSESGWGDLDDDDLFGDENEVTEADFNFFDQPDNEGPDGKEKTEKGDEDDMTMQLADHEEDNNNEPTTAGVKRSQPVEGEEKSWLDVNHITIQSPGEETVASSTNDEEDNEVVRRTKKRKSIFSPLNFNPLISSVLDSKYSQGGRFFVPNPENEDDNDDTSSNSSSDSEDDNNREATEGSMKKSDHENINEELNNNFYRDKISNSPYQQQQQRQAEEEAASLEHTNYTNIWISILLPSLNNTYTSQPEKNPVDSSAVKAVTTTNGNSENNNTVSATNSNNASINTTANNNNNNSTSGDGSNTASNNNNNSEPDMDTAISELVQHVVWENGLLSALIPSGPKREAPDSAVVKRVSSIFPEIQKLSLLHVMSLNASNQPNAHDMNYQQNYNNPDSITRLGTPVTEPKIEAGSGDDKAIAEETMKKSSPLLGDTDNSNAAAGFANSNPEASSATEEQPDNNDNSSSTTGGSHSIVNTPSNIAPHAAVASNSLQQQQQLGSASAGYSIDSKPPEANSTIFPISVPFYSVLRAQDQLKARAPILRFWKVFGLTPQHGPKDLTTVMVTPGGKGMLASASAFLNFLKTTYEGCALGEMDLPEMKDLNSGNGIIPYHCNQENPLNMENTIKSIKDALGQVSQYLPVASSNSSPRNICFIVTDPFADASFLVPIIQHFFNLQRSWTSIQPGCNVFLQIIEAKDIAAKDTIIMPSQYKMVKVALNMYDKCLLPTGDSIQGVTSTTQQRTHPAFTLARIPPAKINFRLSESPSLSLLDEDTLMHVAYAVSKDKRWVTAAWTDQWGEISKVEVFHLRKNSGRFRSFDDVCAEIWEKTVLLMSKIKVRWRVALAKVGIMEESELSTWLLLSEPSIACRKISFIYFLSANTNPSLVISGDYSMFPFGKYLQKDKKNKESIGGTSPGGNTSGGGVGSVGGGGPTTPATPQRATDTDSPDSYGGNIATPSSAGGGGSNSGNHINGDSSKNEPDESVVVDIKDDTHGIILGNRVEAISDGLSANTSRAKPLITGFLLKPGLNHEIEHRLFEVSLVHCPTPYEGSMKSLLIHYRRLASLGDYTGVSNNEERGHIPWHIEAVDKMLRVLNYLE